MCFLEPIFPQQFFYHLPHNAHHWNGVHIGSGNAGYQVGSTWPGSSKTYAYFTGSTGLEVEFLPLNDIEAVKKSLAAQDVCAVIIEGIMGVGGIQVPDNQFLQELREVCTATGTVLILDEIQSGYGRSGKFFAHQYSGIRPDLITVAKGIANGFPMSGLLISPMFTPVYGMLGTTFGGNHLACAAALAVLDVMEDEKLIDNAAKVGQFLMDQCSKIPQIKEVRGRGMMIGLEFEQPIKEIRQALLYDKHIFTGVSGTHVIRLLPPLCLSMEEAAQFIEALKSLL